MANIYVSPTGSDISGDGSSSNPYQTVYKAWSVAVDGDTIILKDGTYNETQALTTPKSLTLKAENITYYNTDLKVTIVYNDTTNREYIQNRSASSKTLIIDGIRFKRTTSLSAYGVGYFIVWGVRGYTGNVLTVKHCEFVYDNTDAGTSTCEVWGIGCSGYTSPYNTLNIYKNNFRGLELSVYNADDEVIVNCKNNIFDNCYQIFNYANGYSGNDIDYNCYNSYSLFTGGGGSQGTKGANDLDNTDPLFVSSTSIELSSSSPCINAGTVVTGYIEDYAETAPDIGVFEYGNYVEKLYITDTLGLTDSTKNTINYFINETLNIVDILEEPLRPAVEVLTPNSDIYSRLPQLYCKAQDYSQTKCKFYIYTDVDELIFTTSWLNMTSIGNNRYEVYYKLQESDGYLPRVGNFKLKVLVEDVWGYQAQSETTFTILPSTAEIDVTSIVRRFDGSHMADVTIALTNPAEDRVDIRLLHQKIKDLNNYKEPCTIVSSSEGMVEGHVIKGVKTEATEKTISVVWKYSDKDELIDYFNKKAYKFGVKVYVYNNGQVKDISKFIDRLSLSRESGLNASELSFSLKAVELLSPFSNNVLNSGDIPLLCYGNKVVYKIVREVNGSLVESQRFVGYIATTEVSPDEVRVVCYDKLREFSRKLVNEKEYEPDSATVTEYLRTFDGVKFESDHSSWLDYPPPKIYLGDELLDQNEYVVDFARGIVYLYKNPFTSYDIIENIYDVDDTSQVENRQKINLGYALDVSSSVTVKHLYKEKVSYSCIDGIAPSDIWIERKEELIIDEDFTVDYTNNKIILFTPIPNDTSTIADHRIYVSSRDVKEVSATYSYSIPGTNDVEDIIKDLAEEVGFTSSELTKNIINERLYSTNGKTYYTKYNNLETFTVKKDGNVVNTEMTDEDKKEGKIILKDPVLYYDKLLDPIVSLNSVEYIGCNVSLDTNDYKYADKSIKGEFTSSGYMLIDYDKEYFRIDASLYGRIAIWVKSNVAQNITITLQDSNNSSPITQDYVFSLNANEWTKCLIDVTSLTFASSIGVIKIAPSNTSSILNIDYIYIPENEITINYTYNTLQATGITVNRLIVDYTNHNNLFDILEEVLNQVSPNYLVRVDEDGYLVGNYERIRFTTFISELYRLDGLQEIEVWGKFLLEDYLLKHTLQYNTELSDENVYSSVIVIGELAEKNNIALVSTAEDVCTWVTGYSYKTSTWKLINETNPFPAGSLPYVYWKIFQDKRTLTTDTDAILDNDVYSGFYWYIYLVNDPNRPYDPTDSPMIRIALPEPIKWEEINICVGSFRNKVIREEMYIKVEDEYGYEWYPSGNFANRQNANTGHWLTWKNEFNSHRKIKYITIYCSEAWAWIETNYTGGKK